MKRIEEMEIEIYVDDDLLLRDIDVMIVQIPWCSFAHEKEGQVVDQLKIVFEDGFIGKRLEVIFEENTGSNRSRLGPHRLDMQAWKRCLQAPEVRKDLEECRRNLAFPSSLLAGRVIKELVILSFYPENIIDLYIEHPATTIIEVITIDVPISALLETHPDNDNFLSFIRDLDLPFTRELRVWIDNEAWWYVEHVFGQRVERFESNPEEFERCIPLRGGECSFDLIIKRADLSRMIGEEEEQERVEKENSSLEEPGSSEEESNSCMLYYNFGLACGLACVGVECYQIYCHIFSF
jgi:hypothetical protein